MTRNRHERTITARWGPVRRGSERGRRGARDIDLAVSRERHRAPRPDVAVSTRPLRLY